MGQGLFESLTGRVSGLRVTKSGVIYAETDWQRKRREAAERKRLRV